MNNYNQNRNHPNLQQVNFSELDFSNPAARSMTEKDKEQDCLVAIRMGGGSRKSSSFDISLNSFLGKKNPKAPKEWNFKPKIMSIGTSKFKQHSDVYLVFENFGIDHYPISYATDALNAGVSYKGAAIKVFTALGIEIPDVPATSTTIQCKMEPIHGQPNVYKLVPYRVNKKDAKGTVISKSLN